jgi:nitrate reductase alpha subunit
VVRTPEEVVASVHPLAVDGFKFIFLTPKFRHCTHTTPADTDKIAVWFGPFGDVYRRDRRLPFVTEGYVDMNPDDAKALGVEDGDYVHVDSDPSDRPFRGYKPGGPGAKVARLLCRARYYYGPPRGVTAWFNQLSHPGGAAMRRADGLAKNPDTGYQAMFRYGSHQSGTRAWLRPTLLTDSLVRKDGFGQTIGKGFHADIHCAAGAPKESVVKIAKAEDGGLGGRGPWLPVLKRLPDHEPGDPDYFAGGSS